MKDPFDFSGKLQLFGLKVDIWYYSQRIDQGSKVRAFITWRRDCSLKPNVWKKTLDDGVLQKQDPIYISIKECKKLIFGLKTTNLHPYLVWNNPTLSLNKRWMEINTNLKYKSSHKKNSFDLTASNLFYQSILSYTRIKWIEAIGWGGHIFISNVSKICGPQFWKRKIEFKHNQDLNANVSIPMTSKFALDNISSATRSFPKSLMQPTAVVLEHCHSFRKLISGVIPSMDDDDGMSSLNKFFHLCIKKHQGSYYFLF